MVSCGVLVRLEKLTTEMNSTRPISRAKKEAKRQKAPKATPNKNPNSKIKQIILYTTSIYTININEDYDSIYIYMIEGPLGIISSISLFSYDLKIKRY